jgi:alpha-tubulin suppressor-like RCC1 family protein
LAWDADGRVWSWGSFAEGKLGYMVFDSYEQPYPKLVESLASRVI